MSNPRITKSSDRGDDAGNLARCTCGCSVIEDFDGREYQQLSLLCAGGVEHLRRVANPTKGEKKRHVIPFKVDDSERKKIDRTATELGLSRSQLIRDAVMRVVRRRELSRGSGGRSR